LIGLCPAHTVGLMTSGAEDNFESSISLLKWAGDDIHRLQRSVDRFFDHNPVAEVTEIDPETGTYAHKIKITKRPPVTWRRLTFRIICDLRHCIDQAMYAAVQTVLGAAPAEDIYFPWARDPTDLTHRRKKIPDVLWPTLSRLEPYKRGDDYPGGDDTIYAIRNAAGPNKHRIAVKPQARPTAFKFTGSAEGNWRIPYDGWDGDKNEFTIIRNLPPGAKRDYECEFAFNIAFGDIEGLSGKPVLPILDHFGRYTEFVINSLLNDSEQIAGL
jgi:hypothetical protein